MEIRKAPIEAELESDFERFETNKTEQALMWAWLAKLERICMIKALTLRLKLENELGRSISDSDIDSLSREIQLNTDVFVTSRSLSTIRNEFNLSAFQFADFYNNKKVLDVGSGKSVFAAQIEGKKANSEVFSVDLSQEALREVSGQRAAASSEFLPYRSGEFDTVMATWSVPYWANSPKMVDRSFREIKRVAKVGGRILFTPITGLIGRNPNRTSRNQVQSGDVTFEADPRVSYILQLNQLKFIDILRDSMERGEVEVILRHAAELDIPKSAILKKLK